MLPNLKSEASVLQKILSAEFGVELPRHNALAIVARMKGFTGYQELQRGFAKIANQLFEGNVVHITNGAGDISGEDEVCCFLQQILGLHYQNQKIFAIETRGNYMPMGGAAGPQSEISLSAPHDISDIGSDFRAYLLKPYGDTLNRFNVFNEIFIRDLKKASELVDEELTHYFDFGKFHSGIIAADLRYTFASEIHARTKFSVVHHLAVEQSYRSSSSSVRNAIEKIQANDPGSLTICWLSGTDISGRRSKALSPVKTVAHSIEVEGAGFVSNERDRQFFSEVIDCLVEMNIPTIKVPYLKKLDMFTNFGASLTTKMIKDRDLILRSVLTQMAAHGFIQEKVFSHRSS
ncbi:hypothetical protein [Collimonas sp.]|jgi:hypothetical protein|uniref:hypothetical protein n=1 Tax=Collimonas sp. TaxID=1963772 RepID=UPI002C765267|nr:hypothetical protein [Collimonas sp.]HWW05881.1 hypothetical protein [Collimonas sp.]